MESFSRKESKVHVFERREGRAHFLVCTSSACHVMYCQRCCSRVVLGVPSTKTSSFLTSASNAVSENNLGKAMRDNKLVLYIGIIYLWSFAIGLMLGIKYMEQGPREGRLHRLLIWYLLHRRGNYSAHTTCPAFSLLSRGVHTREACTTVLCCAVV